MGDGGILLGTNRWEMEGFIIGYQSVGDRSERCTKFVTDGVILRGKNGEKNQGSG